MKSNGQFVPKIEHNVPMPEKAKPLTFSNIVRQMKPKDSVWVPLSYKSPNAVTVYGSKIIGKGKWMTRQEKLGTRLWRIK